MKKCIDDLHIKNCNLFTTFSTSLIFMELSGKYEFIIAVMTNHILLKNGNIFKINSNINWLYYLIMDDSKRIETQIIQNIFMIMTSSANSNNSNSNKKFKKKKKNKKNSDKSANKFCKLHKINFFHMNKNCFQHNKIHFAFEYKIAIIIDEHALFSATSVDWILDSGAIKHVCCNKVYFDHLKSYNTNLKWGSVDQISINDIDLIWFILFDNFFLDSFSAIWLKNVLFVFNLNINLLFLNKFQENEYEIHFEFKLCQIRKNIVIINGIYWQNLIYFNFKSKTKKAFILINSDFWHARMKHIDQKTLSKLSKTITNVKYSHKDSSAAKHLCEICAKTNLISKIKKISND